MKRAPGSWGLNQMYGLAPVGPREATGSVCGPSLGQCQMAPDTLLDVTRWSGTTLRIATGADFTVLRALFDDPSFLNWGGSGRLPDDQIREKYLGSRQPDVECFIVHADGQAVGLAMLHAEPVGGGIDLILLPAARGHGVGRAAVALLVHQAREQRGWPRITVDPECANKAGIRFWQAVGFVPDRIVDEEPGRRPYLLMVLRS